MSDQEKALAGNEGHKQENESSVHKIADQPQNINSSPTNTPSTPVEKRNSKVVRLHKKMSDDDFRQAYNEVIKQSKKKVSMARWISSLGFHVNGTTTNYKCPFHEERTGSFHIYEDGSHCYGECDRSFDHLDFAMLYKGWDKKLAVENLAEYAGVDIPWKQGKKTRKSSNTTPPAAFEKPVSGPVEPEPKVYTDKKVYTDEETHTYLAWMNPTREFLREHFYPNDNPVLKRVLYKYDDPEDPRAKVGRHFTKTDGGWLSGRRVEPRLYRQEDLESSPSDVLCNYFEGEKCADMGHSLGMLSVTAGAKGDFAPHARIFVPLFAGRDVILFPDNDDGGRKAFLKIATLLHGTAKSVKIINLPLNVEKEDIYEFVLKTEYCNGDREMAKARIQEMINAAPLFVPEKATEEQPEETETDEQLLQRLCGLDYTPVIPQNFTVVEGLLAEVTHKKDDVVITRISMPFVVSGFVSDLRSSDTLLQLKGPQGETVLDADLSNKSFSKAMTSFLRQSLDPHRIRSVQKYVTDYQLYNREIKKLVGRSQTGWDVNGDYHIPLIPSSDGTVWMDPFHLQAYKTGGDKDKQYELLKKILRTRAGMIVLAALTATINFRTGGNNSVVNVHGMNANGKSTAVRFAMSLLGDYKEQKLTWFATKVGLEQRLSSMLHVPIWIEERETGSADSSDLANFVYQFLEEVGKLRGNKNDMARTISKLNGVVITTAEKDLESAIAAIRKKSGGKLGMYRRVFEIDADKGDLYTLPDNTKLDMAEINYVAKDNYGWFGVEWVNYIKTNIDTITGNYRHYLSKIKGANLHGMDSLFASLITVMEALNDMGVITAQDADILGRHVLDNLKQTESRINEKRDITIEFMEHFNGWIYSRKDTFIYSNSTGEEDDDIVIPEDIKKIAGVVFNNRDVFITNYAVKSILEDMSFVPRQLWRRLLEKGLLKCNKGRLDYRKRIGKDYLTGYFIMGVFSQSKGPADDAENGEKGGQNG